MLPQFEMQNKSKRSFVKAINVGESVRINAFAISAP